jgi:hypothetical protein
MKYFMSKVKNNEGLCTPVWLNSNTVMQKLYPPEMVYAGFFKNIEYKKFIFWKIPVKKGEEFWGYLNYKDNCIHGIEE